MLLVEVPVYGSSVRMLRTRTGVWVEHRDALFAGCVLEKPLLGAVVTGTCQASEINEQWNLVERVEDRLWWHVEVEAHLATGGGGIVGAFEELAAETGNGRFCRHCHASVKIV